MRPFWRSNEHDFFDVLTEVATRLTAAASLSHRFFSEPSARPSLSNDIGKLKAEADSLVHNLVLGLDKTVVTSVDREDIHQIGIGLVGLIDLIAGTAHRAVTFRAVELREPAVRLAHTLSRSAQHLEAGVALLRQRKEALQRCVEVKALEEEGDAIYFDALGSLFAAPPDVAEVLKWKELYDRLEEALDRAQRVAHLLESFTLKHR